METIHTLNTDNINPSGIHNSKVIISVEWQEKTQVTAVVIRQRCKRRYKLLQLSLKDMSAVFCLSVL